MCQSLFMYTCLIPAEPGHMSHTSASAAAKRPRSEAACPLAVSPCGCCAAYASDEGLLCLALCSPLTAATIGRCSGCIAWLVVVCAVHAPCHADGGNYDQVVQSLAAVLDGCSVLDHSVWGLAVCTARLQKRTGVCCGSVVPSVLLHSVVMLSSVGTCVQSEVALNTSQVLPWSDME